MTEPPLADLVDEALRGRVELDPEKVEKGLVRLVLMLIETLRQVIERQAIRRVEAGSVTDDEIERLGLTLLRLEEKMNELKRHFGLDDADLALKLHLPLDDL